MTRKIICTKEDNNATLENMLRSRGISRRTLILLKNTPKGMTRKGEIIRTVDKVHEGDEIILHFPEEKSFVHQPNPDLRADIICEDEDIIIYDKPPRMPVHRSKGHNNDTLANLFAATHQGMIFRAVNRLDADTSGLCLGAKNKQSAFVKEIEKTYFAVCGGVIGEYMRIDAPIGREEGSVIKRCIREGGQRAVTEVFPMEIKGGYSLVRLKLLTGRTHQIRVHLASVGHPLAGDGLYGGDMTHINRQALHCGEMTLVHPVTGEKISVNAPLPEDICKLLQK